MSTSFFQPPNWTPQEDPFSSACFEVHQHLDDVPYLLDEPAWGAHDGAMPESESAPSFSPVSKAEALTLFFMI